MELSVLPDEGVAQAVRVVNKFRDAKAALDAESATVYFIISIPADAYDPAIFHPEVHLAANTAVRAGGLHLMGWRYRHFRHQGTHRAAHHALAAGFAYRLKQRAAAHRADLLAVSITAYLDGTHHGNFVAGANALLTEDAVITVDFEKGIAVVHRA